MGAVTSGWATSQARATWACLAPEVIRQAVWLYYRFSLSLRERGIDASYEAVRNWCRKFERQIARNLKQRRAARSPRWQAHRTWLKAVA